MGWPPHSLSGDALPTPKLPFPLRSSTHHTYHQSGGTKYLSNDMQIKFSIGKSSLQEKGRREQVNAEKHNLYVSEPK